jgi:hypothetical protein
MQVSFGIPEELGRQIADEPEALTRAALEGLVLEATSCQR